MSAQEAFRSFGQRALLVDIMMNLPFVIALALTGDFLTRRLLLRYPLRDEVLPAIMIFALVSVVFGIVGLLLGQQWSAVAESLRIGTGRLSNRVHRLPINKHPIEVFAFLVFVFLSTAFACYWALQNARRAV